MTFRFLIVAAVSGVTAMFDGAYAQSLGTLPDIPATVPSPSRATPTQSTGSSNAVTKPRPSPVASNSSPSAAPKLNDGQLAVGALPPPKPVVPELPPPSKTTKDFMQAFWSGNKELAEVLLQQGADINCPNCDSDLLLNSVVLEYTIPQSIRIPFAGALDWVIAKGAEINAKGGARGNTALNVSVFYAHLYGLNDPLMRKLLNHGANPQLENVNGQTPIYPVVRLLLGNPNQKYARPLLDELIRAGANINHQDRNGNTPFLLGLQSNCDFNAISTVISYGADPTIKNKAGVSAYDIVYGFALNGAKQCNALLGIMNQKPAQPKLTTNSDPAVTVAARSTLPPAPESFAGKYVGVLRVKSPSPATVAVTGEVKLDGSAQLQTTVGIVTYGNITEVEKNKISFLLRSRAPEGARYRNGKRETDPFTVNGTVDNRIYYGNYVATYDSGEFILCPADIADQNDVCKPTFLESLNSALNSLSGLLGSVGGSK